MTEEREISYKQRRHFEKAGLPWELRWGSVAVYLAAWVEARQKGTPMSVAKACEAAGFSTDALRQRRRYSAEFAAAERWARKGEPYAPLDPDPDEHDPALDVVVDPAVTDTTWPPRPVRPRPEVYREPATGPTNTTLAPKPLAPKRRPTRRHTPQWVAGDGYYRP